MALADFYISNPCKSIDHRCHITLKYDPFFNLYSCIGICHHIIHFVWFFFLFLYPDLQGYRGQQDENNGYKYSFSNQNQVNFFFNFVIWKSLDHPFSNQFDMNDYYSSNFGQIFIQI
jgi:hypothetical protein